jgi:hypothetical protein
MKIDSKSGLALALLVGLSCLLVVSQMQRGNAAADTARLEACVSQHTFRIETARGMGEKPSAWDEQQAKRCADELAQARASSTLAGPLQGAGK